MHVFGFSKLIQWIRSAIIFQKIHILVVTSLWSSPVCPNVIWDVAPQTIRVLSFVGNFFI